jgi:hypothetical protein
MLRTASLASVGAALVLAMLGCDLNREDGTWGIFLQNDTPDAVVVKDCTDGTCSRFRYVKRIPPETKVAATDHGDGTSWWLVESGGRLVGCLTLNLTDRVGGNVLRLSDMVACPF